MTPGIQLFHKPVGVTSFSVVQSCTERVRAEQANGAKGRVRICHGGTLDPFASGLLLILVGKATRLFDHLHAIPKEYDATVRWGVETDNLDPLGREVFTGDPSQLSPGRLEQAISKFIGWQDQVPPATSAKRVGGERAYEKVHRGEAVELPPSRVYLHEAKWMEHDLPSRSRLRLVVRGGYYVRALARDLGRMLGCGAHLTNLHRTKIGPWNDPGPRKTLALHGRHLLPWARGRILSDQEIGELRQDRPIPLGEVRTGEWKLPRGFPDPDAPVRGFHLEKMKYLLRVEDGRLQVLNDLGAGL